MKLSNKKILVLNANCPQNHKCPSVQICPVSALSQILFEAPTVNYDLCIKCGKCTMTCPKGALI